MGSLPRRVSCALAALALFAAGCTLPVRVMRAVPQAMRSTRPAIAVEPIHFGITRVNNQWEDEWLGTRTPAQQDGWAADKRALNTAFANELLTGAMDTVRFVAPFGSERPTLVVRAVATNLEPRSFRFMNDSMNVVDVTIQLVTPDGHVIDEVAILARVGTSLARPSISDAMEDAGKALGRRYASYLSARFAASRATSSGSSAAVEDRAAASSAPSIAPSSAPTSAPTPTPGAAPFEIVLAPVPVTPTIAPILAPLTPVTRVARPTRAATNLRMFGLVLGGEGYALDVIAWLVLMPLFRSATSTGWMADQAAFGAIPVAGPFVAATRVPSSAAPFVMIDAFLGACQVVGLALAIPGLNLRDRPPTPLRPGQGYAMRWMLAPFAGTAPGMSFAAMF